MDKKLGKSVPDDFREDDPWPAVFRSLLQDERFWAEQVVHFAVAWTASGGKAVPVAALEMIAGARAGHCPTSSRTSWSWRRRRGSQEQANRDKRDAKRKRIQNEREELQRLRGDHRKDEHKSDGKKGGGKDKSKDQAGNPLCFSWGSGTGPCADVPAGGECKCKVK